jgi:hypothetical protein
MSDIVCNACNKPCDAITQKSGMYNEATGAQMGRPVITGVSHCCKTAYRLDRMACIAYEAQQEELASREAQRGLRL